MERPYERSYKDPLTGPKLKHQSEDRSDRASSLISQVGREDSGRNYLSVSSGRDKGELFSFKPCVKRRIRISIPRLNI